MKYYLISYDLKTPGKNYSALYDEIKSLGDYQHPMESMWIIHVEDTVQAIDIRERLKGKMDSNDSIFVVDVSGTSYAGWLPSSFWNWYRKQ